MRLQHILRYGIMLALLATLARTQPGQAAPQFQESTWIITGPAENSTVSGQVSIQGTATHPNFNSYGVLYASGPRPTAESQWIPIAFDVKSMVVNGALATWDTTTLPNGQYTLALALYETSSGEPKLYFVNNLTVFNAPATPTSEPTETPTPETTEPLPTDPGEQPVVPIVTVEQPPTATPRATPAAPGATPLPAQESGEFQATDIFSMAAIKEAFITGVWLAVFLYIIGGLYQAGKVALRYYIRQQRRTPKA